MIFFHYLVNDSSEERVDDKDKKMQRTKKNFSSLQVEQLMRRFQRNQYLQRTEPAQLAATLGLTAYQVLTFLLQIKLTLIIKFSIQMRLKSLSCKLKIRYKIVIFICIIKP